MQSAAIGIEHGPEHADTQKSELGMKNSARARMAMAEPSSERPKNFFPMLVPKATSCAVVSAQLKNKRKHSEIRKTLELKKKS